MQRCEVLNRSPAVGMRERECHSGNAGAVSWGVELIMCISDTRTHLEVRLQQRPHRIAAKRRPAPPLKRLVPQHQNQHQRQRRHPDEAHACVGYGFRYIRHRPRGPPPSWIYQIRRIRRG